MALRSAAFRWRGSARAPNARRRATSAASPRTEASIRSIRHCQGSWLERVVGGGRENAAMTISRGGGPPRALGGGDSGGSTGASSRASHATSATQPWLRQRPHTCSWHEAQPQAWGWRVRLLSALKSAVGRLHQAPRVDGAALCCAECLRLAVRRSFCRRRLLPAVLSGTSAEPSASPSPLTSCFIYRAYRHGHGVQQA